MEPVDDLTIAYRAALNPDDPQARAVLGDLADVCMVGQSSHVPGDATATAFREGKRAVWLYIAGRLALPVLPEVRR